MAKGHRRFGAEGASGHGHYGELPKDAKKRIISREGHAPLYTGETKAQRKERLRKEAEANRRADVEGTRRRTALDPWGKPTEGVSLELGRLAGRNEAKVCDVGLSLAVTADKCSRFAPNAEKGPGGKCLDFCRGLDPNSPWWRR